VWVWPHPVEPILREVIQTTGVPECFCGFAAAEVFLCTHEELVTAAWNFQEIHERHRRYLGHLVATPRAARHARDFATLGRLGRIERDAYQHAFSIDPLLPRTLLPKSYKGDAVEEQHQDFRRAVRRRARELAAA
jgi:DNA-binding transcriptional regulator PaaX